MSIYVNKPVCQWEREKKRKTGGERVSEKERKRAETLRRFLKL